MPDTVLDPGHGGGRTAGGSSALGVRGPAGTLEKDVTLAVARHVAASLGAGVALTRSGDENPTLAARARTARDGNARVFLSLHANRGPRDARGSELWIHSRGGATSARLAGQLRSAMQALGVPDRGIKAADMGVLRPEHLAPGAAACLLELDFLSHPEGERRLRDPAAIARLGRAIADGVRAFLAAPARARKVARRARTSALDVTTDSPQQEQSDAVLDHVARSMQQKEGTRFDQVHYDSGVVNFGIGSWTGPRIATVLDMYETVATEQGATATLYGYFGGQTAFEDLRARFRSGSVGVPMAADDKSALESLGGDKSLRDAQIRLLAQEVKKYVDAVEGDNKYPFIDGYMNAISEVAAHVLAHASHQHGQVNDLIAEVIANHGGDAAFGQEITAGTMTERTFLGEIGEAVTRRVQAKYQAGVRKRYQDIIAQFDGSGLGYFFHPTAPATLARPLLAPNWCQIQQDIVSTATSEEQVWTQTNGTKFVESDAAMLARLQAYWRDGVGVGNWQAQANLSATDANGGAWSAAFVSWVLRTAGVPAGTFAFSSAHINYIVAALRNRERSDRTKPFWLYGVGEQDQAQPRPGDILCFNRDGSNFTYESLRSLYWDNANPVASAPMHCNIVTGFSQVGGQRFIQSIGGNRAIPGGNPNAGVTVALTNEIEVDDSGVLVSPPASYLGFIGLVGCV